MTPGRAVARRAVEAGARLVLRPDAPEDRAVILCYHSVHPTAAYASATPSEFADHLDWLTSNCRVVPLSQIRCPSAGSGPRVALTFDDGLIDNWQYATPLLAARGLTATFFLTTGFIERVPEVVERMAELWSTDRSEIAPLRWNHVLEMRDAGMRFGSHTWSHPNLAALLPAAVTSELRHSKDLLEDRLQEEATSVAYPFGKLRHHVTDRTVEIARQLGFSSGVAVAPRALAPADDALRLPRLVVGGDDVSRLAAKVLGQIDWHAHVRERLPRPLWRLAR